MIFGKNQIRCVHSKRHDSADGGTRPIVELPDVSLRGEGQARRGRGTRGRDTRNRHQEHSNQRKSRRIVASIIAYQMQMNSFDLKNKLVVILLSCSFCC